MNGEAMDEIFAAAEKELGRQIAFVDEHERERFITSLHAGIQARLKAILAHEIRNTIIPAVRSELIPMVIDSVAGVTLARLAKLEADVGAELPPPDPLDDVLKDYRGKSEGWK